MIHVHKHHQQVSKASKHARVFLFALHSIDETRSVVSEIVHGNALITYSLLII